MTPERLALEAVTVLAPYIAKAGGEAAKRLGGAVADKVGAIYQKLRGKLVSPGEVEALSDFEQNPDDVDYRAALQLKLKKLFERDPQLLEQLAILIQAPDIKQLSQQSATTTGNDNVTAQVTGIGNAVNIGGRSK